MTRHANKKARLLRERKTARQAEALLAGRGCSTCRFCQYDWQRDTMKAVSFCWLRGGNYQPHPLPNPPTCARWVDRR